MTKRIEAPQVYRKCKDSLQLLRAYCYRNPQDKVLHDLGLTSAQLTRLLQGDFMPISVLRKLNLATGTGA